MARQKWTWTKQKLERAAEVISVVEKLRGYWPLTLRQIYYQLVAVGAIDNTRSRYITLSRLVKWLRIDGKLPWEALEDRSRTLTEKHGITDAGTFFDNAAYWFLRGYERCLIQDQKRYLEVWVEKDALLGIFKKIADKYCIRTVVCKGYNSVTFLKDYYHRAVKAQDVGQLPTVLYYGDLDPSGVQALEASVETLEDELLLDGIDCLRKGLNPDQVQQYNLPRNPNAVKRTDPRYPKYIKRFGDYAVELDALHPRDLEYIVERDIRELIDIDLVDEQRELGDDEKRKLERLRDEIIEFAKKKAVDHGL